MTSVELDGSLLLKSSVAFTGRLACISRAEAFDVIRQRGGMPSPAVTKRTQVLIVGELGWPLLDDGRPSNKLSRATALGIPIVSERRFLEMGRQSRSGRCSEDLFGRTACYLEQVVDRHGSRAFTIEPVG